MANPILGPSKVFFVHFIHAEYFNLVVGPFHINTSPKWETFLVSRDTLKATGEMDEVGGVLPCSTALQPMTTTLFGWKYPEIVGFCKICSSLKSGYTTTFHYLFLTSFSSLLLKKVLFDLSLCCNRLLLSSLQLLTSPPRQPANHFASLGDIIVTTLHQ